MNEIHRVSTKAFLHSLGGPCWNKSVKRPGIRRKILALLDLRGEAGATMAIMIDYVYGWDEDGGPIAAESTLRVHICRWNKRKRVIVSHGYLWGYFKVKDDENERTPGVAVFPDTMAVGVHVDAEMAETAE